MNRGDNTAMTRRRFLLTLASTMIVSCADSGRDAGTESLQTSDWSNDVLPKLMADYEAAAQFGRAYLKAHPEYHTAKILMNDIEQALLQYDASIINSTDSDRVVASVKQLMIKEYQHNEVELVVGWVLSLTEARLYAWVVFETDKKTSNS